MNNLAKIFLSIILLMAASCAPATAEAGTNQEDPHLLVLNTNMVRSSQDIENAIHTVTEHGKLPGTVELDGAAGPFIFSEGDDRSIAIEYSNVSIIGKNKPFFPNGFDCFLFANPALTNITIKDVSMICDHDGINAKGNFSNIKIEGNFFRSSVMGIETQDSMNWNIINNIIIADGHGIDMFSSSNMTIDNNSISASTALDVEGVSNSKITNNKIGPSDVGILLKNNLDGIEIFHNALGGIRNSGLLLNRGNTSYHIDANAVSCKVNFPCQVMIANP